MLQALRDPLRVFTDFAVQPASYVVFTDGVRYYVKSGLSSAIEYVDTDASKAIQYAVDRLKGVGGTVFLKTGVYKLSESIRLWSGIHVVGEAKGTLTADIGGNLLKATGVVLKLPATVKHAFVVGGGDYCDNSFSDIVLKNIAVDGGGIIKIGSEGECWGASPAILENLLAFYYSNYPNGSDIYALDIWHSLHLLVKNVSAFGGPVLRLGTDFRVKSWNFGNSVFEELFSLGPPPNVPNFHVYSAGDPTRTNWNLLVFIRPQTLGGGAGFWLNGETSEVKDVTIIGGNFEGTLGLVLRGLVGMVFADLHYPWGVRLCKNTGGRIPWLPRFLRALDSRSIPYDSDGRVIVYESDCVTDAGTRLGAEPPVISSDLNLLPFVDYAYPSPATILLNIGGGVMDLTKTSISGSGVYGADNAPLRDPSYVARVPAGTTLDPGVNRFYFYTFYAPRYTPPYPAVFKWSGWDQGDLDVQARNGPFISACNCWQVIVEIINRTGAPLTLSAHLDMLILTYYVRWRS